MLKRRLIREKINDKDISLSELLHFYDTTRNLMDRYPKKVKPIKKLQNEIKIKIQRAS